MSKHTKGEWRAYYDSIVIDNPNPNHPHREIRIADVYGVEDGEGEENAARIAKCVNGYDELVEALENCFTLLKQTEVYFLNQEKDAVALAYSLGKKAHDINLLTHKAKQV